MNMEAYVECVERFEADLKKMLGADSRIPIVTFIKDPVGEKKEVYMGSNLPEQVSMALVSKFLSDALFSAVEKEANNEKG